MKSLNKLGDDLLELSKEKGFYTKIDNPKELMLIVGEVAEAMEALRSPTIPQKFNSVAYDKELETLGFVPSYEKYLKGTFGEELIDVLIRTLILARANKVDIDTILRLKTEYNKLRPKLNGKLF